MSVELDALSLLPDLLEFVELNRLYRLLEGPNLLASGEAGYVTVELLRQRLAEVFALYVVAALDIIVRLILTEK